ncbi:MAG: hypothetical protein ACTMKU_05920 [Actinomycetaceae bacterium]
MIVVVNPMSWTSSSWPVKVPAGSVEAVALTVYRRCAARKGPLHVSSIDGDGPVVVNVDQDTQPRPAMSLSWQAGPDLDQN